jgi:hypothetical protein
VVEPVSLIVAALAAGALKGAGETATAAVKDAYTALKNAVAARFAGNPRAELALQEHAEDPETNEKPLAKQVEQSGAATDPRIVELAQELMRLLDADGTKAGTYDLRGAQGVQVGDRNTQTNTFH